MPSSELLPRTGRLGRLEAALEMARGGGAVAVYEDPRRYAVIAACACVFAAIGAILALGSHAFERVLACCAFALALGLLAAYVRARRRAHRPAIEFDASGFYFRRNDEPTFIAWNDVLGAQAVPVSRRFVVALVLRDQPNDGPMTLPATSEFRAHELIAVMRAYHDAALRLTE